MTTMTITDKQTTDDNDSRQTIGDAETVKLTSLEEVVKQKDISQREEMVERTKTARH